MITALGRKRAAALIWASSEGGAAVFVGIGYALGSVVLGLAAAFAGMWLAARWSR